ncbi:MAG: nucleoside-diphosphate sugar epimerase/dehydratase, partial [Thermoanaerobaculia bacterium]
MIRRQTRRLQALFVAADVLATVLALGAAWLIRFESVWPTPKGAQPFENYVAFIPILVAIWPVVFYFHRLYQIRRDRSTIDEVLAVIVAASLGTILLVGLLSFWRGFTYTSRQLLVLFLFLDVFFVSLVRFGIRKYLETLWSTGAGVRRTLIVGAGHAGRALADKLLDHPATGLKPVGFADDDPLKRVGGYRGLAVLGTTSEVTALIRAHEV